MCVTVYTKEGLKFGRMELKCANALCKQNDGWYHTSIALELRNKRGDK